MNSDSCVSLSKGVYRKDDCGKLKNKHSNCSDQTSNSLISVLRCHPWISNADTTQYLEDL